jgi:hypothetical protein
MTLFGVYKITLSLHSLFKVSIVCSPLSHIFLIWIISPLEHPTNNHTYTHNASSPTGLLPLSPSLLSHYTMKPVLLPATLIKKAAWPSDISVTNYQSTRHLKMLQLLSLTFLWKPPTTKLTYFSLTFCCALEVDCDSLSVICSYCGACLRYGCSDWNCNKMCQRFPPIPKSY